MECNDAQWLNEMNLACALARRRLTAMPALLEIAQGEN